MSLVIASLSASASAAVVAMAPFVALEDADLPPWVKWLVGIAVFLGALRTITRFLRAMANLASSIDRSLPVMTEIASQFRDEDGHSTLKTQLDEIKHAVENNGKEVHQLKDDLQELHGYTHKHRHDLSNQIQQILLKLPPTPKENR